MYVREGKTDKLFLYFLFISVFLVSMVDYFVYEE